MSVLFNERYGLAAWLFPGGTRQHRRATTGPRRPRFDQPTTPRLNCDYILRPTGFFQLACHLLVSSLQLIQAAIRFNQPVLGRLQLDLQLFALLLTLVNLRA